MPQDPNQPNPEPSADTPAVSPRDPEGLGELEDLDPLEEIERAQEMEHQFQHPQWMLGVVLILAFVTLYAGFFSNVIWLLIGSPFVVTLVIYLWARFIHPRLTRFGSRDNAPRA